MLVQKEGGQNCFVRRRKIEIEGATEGSEKKNTVVGEKVGGGGADKIEKSTERGRNLGKTFMGQKTL